MAIMIKDEEIDKKLESLRNIIKNEFKINNCTKTDALRYLLKIHKQGKKTHRNWRDML